MVSKTNRAGGRGTNDIGDFERDFLVNDILVNNILVSNYAAGLKTSHWIDVYDAGRIDWWLWPANSSQSAVRSPFLGHQCRSVVGPGDDRLWIRDADAGRPRKKENQNLKRRFKTNGAN